MNKAEKKILILGGSGFIGRHLTEELLKNSNKVVIVDKKKPANKKAAFYKVDAESRKALKNVFNKEKPAVVFYLAGAINLREKFSDENLNILLKTKIIIDFCLEYRVKKLIFLSSASVYGNAKKVPTPESHEGFAGSIYGIANQLIEKQISESGVPFVILRLANVYGPGQWKTGIIPATIIKFLNGESPIINGNGNQTRDFIYVTDVVKASLLAMSRSGIYNVGSGKDFSIKKITGMIKNMLNSKIEPAYKANKHGGVKKNLLDTTKIKEDFHWNPKINLQEGLDKTIEYYKENG